MTIGSLAPADLATTEGVLARAFRDNPLNQAVIRSDDPARRLHSNLHGMRSLLPVALSHGHVLAARAGGRLAGVLISAPPGVYPLPPPSLGSRLRCLVGQGWRVASRWGRVFDVLRSHHPQQPSWYLGTLGVEPELQGCGVGSALVSAWLEEVDRDHGPAYLETDVEDNVRFYARAGFDVEGEVSVQGVPIWRMWRQRREISTGSLPQ
ncbi:MAG: GNAT family N-acetyltransferase [Myxococcota bacterium]